MKTFEVDFGTISLDMGEIYRMMGSEGYRPEGEVADAIVRVLAEIGSICRPAFGYEILPADGIADRSVEVGRETFETGRILTPFFAGATHFSVFVATAGRAFDAWLHDQKTAGDILTEFVGDAIGSEIAEAAAREMAVRLEEEAASRGLRISNSYSPGYCGWHVAEQQKLFSLLPPAPCGITLNDSSLMTPIKSVSGLIALGPVMTRQAYGCAICNRKDCYKKRTQE